MTVKQFAIVCMPSEGTDVDSTSINNKNLFNDYDAAFHSLFEGVQNPMKKPKGEPPISIMVGDWVKELWVITKDKQLTVRENA